MIFFRLFEYGLLISIFLLSIQNHDNTKSQSLNWLSIPKSDNNISKMLFE